MNGGQIRRLVNQCQAGRHRILPLRSTQRHANRHRPRPMLQQYGPWAVPIRVTLGGAERQDSVAAGLALVDETADLAAVHDAARPFVSLSRITACTEAATVSDAAILALAARD